MSGYNLLVKFRDTEAQAKSLGMRLDYDNYGRAEYSSLYPDTAESLPLYCRDAALYSGNLDNIIAFLNGVEWNANYVRMLKVTTNEKIARAEQNIRNKQLLDSLRDKK